MTSASPLPLPFRLILASTSSYRKDLLIRLGLIFECEAPGVDETARLDEAPLALAVRLARAKAEAIAATYKNTPDATVLVIGCDQVAVAEGLILGKPGNHENAVAQLQAMRGKSVEFLTALCVIDAASGRAQEHVETVTVRMRHLPDDEIERYLQKDKPYDCAGSAKVEGAGVALTDEIISHDPTALIGLPLIALSRILRTAGVAVI